MARHAHRCWTQGSPWVSARVIALADATIETARPARCDGHHENAVLAATPWWCAMNCAAQSDPVNWSSVCLRARRMARNAGHCPLASLVLTTRTSSGAARPRARTRLSTPSRRAGRNGALGPGSRRWHHCNAARDDEQVAAPRQLSPQACARHRAGRRHQDGHAARCRKRAARGVRLRERSIRRVQHGNRLGGSLPRHDARNVVLHPDGYQNPVDPLTVGRIFGTLVLLDGYHRAASFWMFAEPDAVIAAYVPTQFVQPNR